MFCELPARQNFAMDLRSCSAYQLLHDVRAYLYQFCSSRCKRALHYCHRRKCQRFMHGNLPNYFHNTISANFYLYNVTIFFLMKSWHYCMTVRHTESNGTVHIAQLQFRNYKSSTMFATIWYSLFADAIILLPPSTPLIPWVLPRPTARATSFS